MTPTRKFTQAILSLTMILSMVISLLPTRSVSARTGTIWYVATAGNDANYCSTPDLPCATINAAITNATTGDTIKITSGIYTGSGFQVVRVTKDVILLGGWDDSFTAQTGFTIIDGESSRRGITIGTGVGGTPQPAVNTTIDRFIIRNGMGNPSDTYFLSGGGAILGDHHGTVIIKNSAMYQNSASHGGGIFTYYGGSMSIINSTIGGNTATSHGGGVENWRSSQINLSNVTIANNNVTGANGTGGGIKSDGGGIQGGGVLTLRNSIIGSNSAPSQADCSLSFVTVTSGGYNLIENTTGCSFSAGTGDIVGQDPKLGGFNTLGYFLLIQDSPAIDHGNPITPGSGGNACEAVDQLGTSRPIDGNSDSTARCDIGAYETTMTEPAAISSITVTGGSPQSSIINEPYPLPFSVIVKDQYNTSVPYVVVTFAAPSSGASGTFANGGTYTTTETTDSSGIATASTFTANSTGGTYKVNATVSGFYGVASFQLLNGATRYVSPAGNDTSNSCTVLSSPCATIQRAVNQATAGDVIKVAGGTYTHTYSPPYYSVVEISKNLTISGDWNNTYTLQNETSIIDGGNGYIGISIGANVLVTVDHFTIQHGDNTDGAISSSGILTLNNSVIRDTTTNTMYSGAALELIGNANTVINNTVITGNTSVSSSGAIYMSGGLLTINNSFIGNNQGNGVYLHNSSSLNINNVTIANNSGSGITSYPYASASLIAQNSTIVYNGYGLYFNSNSVATVRNSILAQNATRDCSGTISTSDHNIISNANNCSIASGTGNQLNVDAGIYDTPLGSPGYFVLVGDSPALDSGNPSTCLATDQRGITRPQGDVCDIGAYEVDAKTVTKIVDTDDGVCDNDCSLREAIATAADGNIINFSTVGTITLSSTLPAIDKTLIITSMVHSITVDGANNYRIFKVNSIGNLILKNLTLRNGSSSSPCSGSIADSCGGAIYNNGKLAVTNSTFSTSSAELGGAVFTDSGTTDVTNSTFSGNSATSGGGIFNSMGSMSVMNSTFSGNSATSGGAIYNDGNLLTLTSSTLSENTATNGSGLYNASSLRLTNNILANSSSGSDCYNESGAGVISTNSFNLVETNAASPNNCGTPALTGDPNLGNLADNGGYTQTFALLFPSLAIDRGDPAGCPSTDQNGTTRPQRMTCDMGAFEYIPPATAINLSAPTLLAPRYATYNTIPTFAWSPVINATLYEIQLATNSAFTQNFNWYFAEEPTFNLGTSLASNTYYWRARAYNAANQPSGWSVVRSFLVYITIPTLKYPANNVSLRIIPTFRWNTVTGAARYQFEIDNNADFSSPLLSVVQRATYRKPSGPLRGTYYWRVRAQDAAGNWTAWSEVFTVHMFSPSLR